MVLAAVRIDSSSRWMSRSADSDAPMACSCSRRCTRSSGARASASTGGFVSSRMRLMRAPGEGTSLDADRPHFLDVGDPHQALLHAVLLERAHALLQADGEHLGHARMLLDRLLQAIRGDEQLVQAAAPLEAAAAALVAAHGLVEGELALVAAVEPHPLL